MTAQLVLEWLRAGQLDLPLPGSGRTATRWRRLSELTQQDVVAGRLAEAHSDAVAILAELGGRAPGGGELWGVWAAEDPDAAVTARGAGDTLVLEGTKAWCSGAGICTHALVTAHLADGARALFAVDLRGHGVRAGPPVILPAIVCIPYQRQPGATLPRTARGAPGDRIARPSALYRLFPGYHLCFTKPDSQPQVIN